MTALELDGSALDVGSWHKFGLCACGQCSEQGSKEPLMGDSAEDTGKGGNMQTSPGYFCFCCLKKPIQSKAQVTGYSALVNLNTSGCSSFGV